MRGQEVNTIISLCVLFAFLIIKKYQLFQQVNTPYNWLKILKMVLILIIKSLSSTRGKEHSLIHGQEHFDNPLGYGRENQVILQEKS